MSTLVSGEAGNPSLRINNSVFPILLLVVALDANLPQLLPAASETLEDSPVSGSGHTFL